VKHALTKVIFPKLYLDMRNTTLVSHHDLAPGLGDLIEVEERSRTYYRRGDTLQGWERWNWDERGRNDSRLLDVEEPALNDLTGADLLDWTLVGQGSSKAALVDLLEALANPCHEVQRLLAMADDWRSD
jgi:hypothetical protein